MIGSCDRCGAALRLIDGRCPICEPGHAEIDPPVKRKGKPSGPRSPRIEVDTHTIKIAKVTLDDDQVRGILESWIRSHLPADMDGAKVEIDLDLEFLVLIKATKGAT